MLKPVLGLFLLIFVVCTASCSDNSTNASAALGEQLEKQAWAMMKSGDKAALEAIMSPEFQSSHSDAARNKEQEITLILSLNMGDYTLSNFQVTLGDTTMVVTYQVSTTETINGKAYEENNLQRLSVWQKNANGWQWIAHANLAPLSST